MALARLRRFAWLLMLVLVTGLGMPMLASAAPCDAAPTAVTHQHADGTAHSHLVRAEYGKVGASGNRDTGAPHHCPGCMTDAACAVSCLGLAVLPTTFDWAALSSTATWSPVVSHVRPGVAPADDIDPPRPVLHS